MTAGLQADISSLRPILCADNHELNRRVSHLTGARISCTSTLHTAFLAISWVRSASISECWLSNHRSILLDLPSEAFCGSQRIDSAAFFGEVKRCGLCHSVFFICELINRADRQLFELIQPSHHCLNPLLPSYRFPCSRIPLDPEDISSLFPN